ncbi:PhzF family phenazine biosynthesis protein [bacterium]|nr:PhzF family phenazine biosynthesis protein [bacterium]
MPHTLIFQVDSFTDTPFRGNPAGVCFPGTERPSEWMQKVAAEMNLSETAFLLGGRGHYSLRWFTPRVEVELCGHATLAAAHILWSEGLETEGADLRFDTLSGELRASRGSQGWVELDFPADPPQPAQAPEGLAEALGEKPVSVLKCRYDWFCVLESEEAVRALTPDFRALAGLSSRGVLVTAQAGSSEYDFVSRFFAPACGIDEDPVTGSAHCCLAPWWAEKLGKDHLTGFQASERGGVVRVEPRGTRVRLAGQAVTVLRAALCG